MNHTILVVDDDVNHANVLSQILEMEGYSVCAAATVKDALEKIRTLLPDLMILDMFMPVLDGISFLKTLMADERTKEIPVIIFTAAQTTEEDKQEGLSLGAQEYLMKGVGGPEDVIAAVKKVLERKSLQGP